jgi:hypothetical protein
MKKILIVILVGFLCLGLAVGASCLTSREFTDVATAVRTNIYPAQLSTKFKLRVGPILLATANMVVKGVVDEPEVSEYLSEVRKVQIGIYDVQQLQPNSSLTVPPEAEQHLADSGWESFVQIRDQGQQVSLFYKQINERVSGVYAIILNQEQLVVVEMQGRLDHLIKKALQEQGLPEGFSMM